MIDVYADGSAESAHLVETALAPLHLRRTRIRIWDGFHVEEEVVGRLRWSYQWWFLLLDDGRHWSRYGPLRPNEHWEIESEPDLGHTHVGIVTLAAAAGMAAFIRSNLMGWTVDLELTELPVREGGTRLGQAGAVFSEHGALKLRRPAPFEPVNVVDAILKMASKTGGPRTVHAALQASPCVVSVAPAVR